MARHLLVLVVATLLAVAYGTRHEQARTRGLRPGQLRRPPVDTRSKPLPPRRFSVLRQGAACLRRLLDRNRLWIRVWLAPTLGPDRTTGLRCLSLPDV